MTASPERASDLGFLKLFYGTLGASPLFLTLAAVSVFYLVAWLRSVPGAFLGFSLALAAFSVCRTGTFNPLTLAAPWGLPILAAAAVFLAVAIRCRHAAACLLGGWCAWWGCGLTSTTGP